jgi:protein-S-isoprenylcysteine O-methyltransferase Ste14
MISWIYGNPTMLWGTLLIVLVVTIATLGLAVANRLVNVEVRRSQNDVTAAAMGIVGVAYAVLLAFIAVATWESYTAADKIVDVEASYIGDLYRETIGLADADVAPIRAGIKKYLEQIVHEEWPSQQAGHINQAGRPTLVHISSLIASLDPKTPRETVIVAELLRTMNALYDARRTRILAADSAIPAIVWWIVAFGSALTVGFTYLFGTHDFRMHVIVTGMVAASMALVIVLIVALDRPFRGDLSVSVQAYENIDGSIAAVDQR